MQRYSATGVVLGNLWMGGTGAYPAEELNGFVSEKALLIRARKMLKDSTLDSGMGFNGLIGAILIVTETDIIFVDGKEYINRNTTDVFIGKLTEEQKDFLEECLYEM